MDDRHADCGIALVLAGGNALGAYQAGVHQALEEAGIIPDRVVGTSIGAINGAIIAGNAAEDRTARLADFWRPAPPTGGTPAWWPTMPDTWRRTGEALGTLLGGRAGMFAGPGSAMLAGTPALFDSSPMARMLATLADFDRLNDGAIRYAATAVDLDSGDDAIFDNRERTITPDHIRASGALLPSFPPITIGDARYVDGGLSANLSLDTVLSDPGDVPLLCIAVDLLPLAAPRAATLGEMIERAQDLTFAIQTRRSIMRWQERYATDPACAGRAVTLAHLAYADQEPEVAGKALDFSPLSVRRRWDAGIRDGAALVARWRRGALPIGTPGLHVVTTACPA